MSRSADSVDAGSMFRVYGLGFMMKEEFLIPKGPKDPNNKVLWLRRVVIQINIWESII